MAAEHNLIPAAQYARLMKIQKQLDDESNAKKKTQDTSSKGDISDAKETDDIKAQDDMTFGAGSKDVQAKVVDNSNDDLNITEDIDNEVKNELPDIKRLKRKRKPVKQENLEDIVVQFSDALRNKVKRLMTYMFRFGRDISLKDGSLYYKNEQIGDVVKLIKSLFGVIPKMPGVGRLRRLLFILSVPSELFTLSTSERKEIAKLQKSNNSDSIDWIKY